MSLAKTVRTVASRTEDRNASNVDLATVAHSLVDQHFNEVLQGDNLAMSLVKAITANPTALDSLAKALAGANA